MKLKYIIKNTARPSNANKEIKRMTNPSLILISPTRERRINKNIGKMARIIMLQKNVGCMKVVMNSPLDSGLAVAVWFKLQSVDKYAV